MPDINDFKLIAQKSERYYSLLANTLGIGKTLKAKEKERLGFYLLILENITGIQDISDLAQLVTDTEFNLTVFGGRKTEDYGVDAIHIDDEERSISVFNFKYRENFKPGQQQSSNEPFISVNFINALLAENTRQLQSKLKENANIIIEKLNSSDEWKLRLFVVSNDEIELKKTDESLKRLEEHYGLEIIPIGLSQICQYGVSLI